MTESQTDMVVEQPNPLRETWNWIRQKNNKFTVPFDTFQTDMADPEKLSKVHEWIQASNPNFQVPLEQFASDMGNPVKKKEHKLASGQPGPEFTPPVPESVTPLTVTSPELKFDDEADRQKALKDLDSQLADQTYRLEHPDLNYQKLADLGKAVPKEPTQLPGIQSATEKQIAANEEHGLRQKLGIDEKDAAIDRLSSAAGTFDQGVVDTFMGALKTVDIAASQSIGRLGFGEKFGEATDPTQGPAYRLADWVEKQVKELFPNDPAYQGEILTDILPSTAAALLSYHVGGALGKTTMAAELAIPATTKAVIQQTAEHLPAAFLASASAAASEYDRALAEGADPKTAMDAWNKNMFTGVPFLISPTFKAFNKATDGYLKYGIKQFAQGGAITGFQTATSHAIENLSAQQTYDKGREILEGVLETGGSGFIIGGLLSGVIGALTRRAATFSTKERSLIERLITYAKEQKAKVDQVDNIDFYKTDEKVEPQATGKVQGTEPVSKSPEKKPLPVQGQQPETPQTTPVSEGVKSEPATTSFIKPEDIHALAKEAGIDYESKEFMAKSKELTGQEHLNDMTMPELTKIKDYLNEQIRIGVEPSQQGTPTPSPQQEEPRRDFTAQEIDQLVNRKIPENQRTTLVKLKTNKGNIQEVEALEAQKNMVIQKRRLDRFIKCLGKKG